jgi:hypothetical protein
MDDLIGEEVLRATRIPESKEPLCNETPGKHGNISLNPLFRKKTPQGSPT